MKFADLYQHANKILAGTSIPLQDLITHVKTRHPRVGEIELYEVDLDKEVSIGHIIYEEDRTSPYSECFDVAIIRFERSLNRCWRRLVCCKELMHVFDSAAEKTSSKERLIILLNDLEVAPLYKDASEMFKSEREALWMAMLVLCPLRLRELYFREHMTISDLENAADKLKIPVAAANAISKPYYFAALQTLTG